MKRHAIAILLVLAAAATVAVSAGWREFPLATYVSRPTVLTTADTTITLPAQYKARETWIINDGTGRVYLHFGAGAVNTATDFFLEPSEAIERISIPWSTLSMRAETSSASVRVLVAF